MELLVKPLLFCYVSNALCDGGLKVAYPTQEATNSVSCQVCDSFHSNDLESKRIVCYSHSVWIVLM